MNAATKHKCDHSMSNIRGIIASVTLAVFVFGGVVAPVLHRIQHGLTWETLQSAPEDATDCDHSQHDVSFETAVSLSHDVQCTLCRRLVDSFGFQTTTVIGLQTLANSAARCVSQYSVSSLSHFLIRAPPAHV